jgi:alpha-L-arabinofuranosidase
VSVISIDPRRKLGHLHRYVYGGFIEHLGRCIYGGIYEEGSPLSDTRGFRTDVLDLLKQLRISQLRWPGGNFVSNYHWQDGIGPKDTRPARPEIAWGGIEANRFGTNEFVEYCKLLGAEPYICLNMGSGTLKEALSWVEYCNSSARTYWAERRRDDGWPVPHRVRYWGLGNEMYGEGQVGSLSADEYVAEATRWARAIKRLDPGAVLVSCGKNGWSSWDRTVIDGLAGLVELHSVHIYTGSDDYWTNVLSPHVAERAIAITSALLWRARYTQRLPRVPRIAYDEWNIWFREMEGALEERYNFSDALAVATYLNIFVRNCRWVRMANLAQMVNAIAPVVTTADGAEAQPIFYPFLLHSEGHLDEAVDVFAEGPVVDAPAEHLSPWPHRIDDLSPFNVVDAAATVDSEGARLALTLVNRSESQEKAEIRLRDGLFGAAVRVRTLTGSNKPKQPRGAEQVELSDTSTNTQGSGTVLDLPPKSFTLLEAPLEA